jgi:hypothetical protein
LVKEWRENDSDWIQLRGKFHSIPLVFSLFPSSLLLLLNSLLSYYFIWWWWYTRSYSVPSNNNMKSATARELILSLKQISLPNNIDSSIILSSSLPLLFIVVYMHQIQSKSQKQRRKCKLGEMKNMYRSGRQIEWDSDSW